MSNRNKPAFPTPTSGLDKGLTKREYTAIHILATMPRLSTSSNIERAQAAIRQADALFAALDGDKGDHDDD